MSDLITISGTVTSPVVTEDESTQFTAVSTSDTGEYQNSYSVVVAPDLAAKALESIVVGDSIIVRGYLKLHPDHRMAQIQSTNLGHDFLYGAVTLDRDALPSPGHTAL